ncbi:hypothetical protein R1flu_007462 [Riccia fluitans]|uniref:Ubiquitin thioesterase OTU n=1 Tax=Riccia fluitans TaxID=41844 RepID=A0ABD1YZ48_9MARC
MLGSVCFSRSLHRCKSIFSATVALSQSHSSRPHAYSTKLISRRPTSTNLPRTIRRSRQRDFPSARSDLKAYVKSTVVDAHVQSCSTRFHHHSSSCLLAGNGAIGATIWHALLPSRHLTSAEREIILPSRKSSDAGRVSVGLGNKVIQSDLGVPPGNSTLAFKPGTLGVEVLGAGADGFQGRFRGINGRFAMAAGLREGSWNVAWDARPARWLHGRHSAWLLFGVCACFSAAAGAPVPLISTTGTYTIAEPDRTIGASADSQDRNRDSQASHGKQVYTKYSVTGIPGDGRCLFRAVAHGSLLRGGKEAPDEQQQRELADELRNKVADELIKRRDKTEWFIEGDFDMYVSRMRQPHVWGGEPELLMLSHVLQMPITVYMADRNLKGGLIAICEYGREYGTENPIRVLYHGFGHYDALQIYGEETTPSKL